MCIFSSVTYSRIEAVKHQKRFYKLPLAWVNYLMKSAETVANPTIASLHTYTAMSSLTRFEIKTVFFHFEKRSRLLQRCRCSCEFISRRIGSWMGASVVPKRYCVGTYLHANIFA
jgi:hypothetical protein